MCEHCKRRKYTADDLERWQRELNLYVAQGKAARDFNPDWAKDLCWTRPEYTCIMRPKS